MLISLAREAFVYGGGDIAVRLVAFAVFPVYAHLFSPSEYGVMELVGTAVSLLAMIAGCGLNNSVQRFYWDPASTPQVQRSLVTTGLTLQVLFGVACCIASSLLVWLFSDYLERTFEIPRAVALLGLASIPLVLIGQYAGDALRLQFMPWRFTLLSFVRNLAGVIAGLTLVLAFGMRLEGIFLGNVLGLALAVGLALWVVPILLQGSFDAAEARRLLHFGAPFVLSGLAYWIFGAMDRWMLSLMVSTEQTGLYGIAFKFAGVLQLLILAFGQAWSPYSIKLVSDRSDYRRVYGKILVAWTMLLAVACCGLSLFASELLFLLTPSEYHRAAPLFGWCAAGIALYGTTQITAVGISLERKTMLFVRAAWLVACLNFLLNLLLIPLLGALGASIATFFAYATLTLMYFRWTQRLHPIEVDYARLLAGVGIIVLAALAGTVLPYETFSVKVFSIKVLLFVGIVWVAARASTVSALLGRAGQPSPGTRL